MRMRWYAIAAGALALMAAPAAAGDLAERGNGMFFNRPGATLDQMLAASAECLKVAEGAESQINGVNVLMGGIGAIIGGAIAGGRLKRTNVENCMLTGGWRLYAMTDAQSAGWKQLGEAGQRAALATLVGAETPAQGTLLRVWRNDYAEPILFQKPEKGAAK